MDEPTEVFTIKGMCVDVTLITSSNRFDEARADLGPGLKILPAMPEILQQTSTNRPMREILPQWGNGYARKNIDAVKPCALDGAREQANPGPWARSLSAIVLRQMRKQTQEERRTPEACGSF
jgi:hypothetical protein